MSALSLTRRRFELFHYVLTGQPIPLVEQPVTQPASTTDQPSTRDASGEAQLPTQDASADGLMRTRDDDDDEDVPPTQVAVADAHQPTAD